MTDNIFMDQKVYDNKGNNRKKAYAITNASIKKEVYEYVEDIMCEKNWDVINQQCFHHLYYRFFEIYPPEEEL